MRHTALSRLFDELATSQPHPNPGRPVRTLEAHSRDRWSLAVRALPLIATSLGLSAWERPFRVSGRHWFMWNGSAYAPVARMRVEAEIRIALDRLFKVTGSRAARRVEHIGVTRKMVANVASAISQMPGVRADEGGL